MAAFEYFLLGLALGLIIILLVYHIVKCEKQRRYIAYLEDNLNQMIRSMSPEVYLSIFKKIKDNSEKEDK